MLFRNDADRVPTLIIVSLCLLDFAIYFTVSNPYLVIAWMVVGLLPKVAISAWNHHHQHLMTFRSPVLNRAMEVVYALHTGISTNLWVLHHVLGHHVNYLDQAKDESAWKDKSGVTMGMVRYSFTIALTSYWRAYQVGRRHPRYQRDFLSAGVIVSALVAVMIWYRPFNGITLFLFPMLFALLATCWATYFHHAGLETENPYEASRNIMNRWYNLFTGNLGYHTAHHVKPGLHWSKLPAFHATIAAKIPRHLYRAPAYPFRWFPNKSGDPALEQTSFEQTRHTTQVPTTSVGEG